jgi:hypothetical protein
MRDSYQHRKDNAKRRGKPFTITFEEFEAFAYETELLTRRGRSKFSYSVDCKIEELGYVPGNLDRLTISQNSKKEVARRRRKKILMYDYQSKTAKVVDTYTPPAVPIEDLPF